MNRNAWMFICVVSLFSFSAFAQLDSPPQVVLNELDSGLLAPGTVLLTGTSTDDVGITRNELFVKNRSTNEFWDGSAWVDNWTRFALPLQEDWSYSIDLPSGSYVVHATVWDTVNNTTLSESLRFVVGAPDIAPPEVSLNALDSGLLAPGTVLLTGTSTDDVGIARNELFVKNLSTNEFWDGSAWVEKDALWNPEKILEITEYAKNKSITIVPNVQLLTHQDRFLAKPYPELLYNEKTYDPSNKKVWEIVLPIIDELIQLTNCLLYTSPSPRDRQKSRMPSSA